MWFRYQKRPSRNAAWMSTRKSACIRQQGHLEGRQLPGSKRCGNAEEFAPMGWPPAMIRAALQPAADCAESHAPTGGRCRPCLPTDPKSGEACSQVDRAQIGDDTHARRRWWICRDRLNTWWLPCQPKDFRTRAPCPEARPNEHRHLPRLGQQASKDVGRGRSLTLGRFLGDRLVQLLGH